MVDNNKQNKNQIKSKQ